MASTGAKRKSIKAWCGLQTLLTVGVIIALLLVVGKNDWNSFGVRQLPVAFANVIEASSTNDNNGNTECEMGTDGTCLVKNDGDQVLPGMTIKSKDDDGIAMVDTGFGVDQQAVGAHKTDILKRFQEIQQYMNDRVLKASPDDVLSTVASECQLRHELCTFWAVIGECEANPGTFVSYVCPIFSLKMCTSALFFKLCLACFEPIDTYLRVLPSSSTLLIQHT